MKTTLSPAEAKMFEQFNNFPVELVGGKFAAGWEHTLHTYGELDGETGQPKNLIKFPHWSVHDARLWARNELLETLLHRTGTQMQDNYGMAGEYFGEYLHPTEIIVSDDKSTYLAEQEFLPHQPLTMGAIARFPHMQEQVLEILEAAENMAANEKRVVDLPGVNVLAKLRMFPGLLSKASRHQSTGIPFENVVQVGEGEQSRASIIDASVCGDVSQLKSFPKRTLNWLWQNFILKPINVNYHRTVSQYIKHRMPA